MLNLKGISTLGEFVIVIGVILASLIFFLSSQEMITRGVSKTQQMSVEQIGRMISNMINRIQGEPSEARYKLRVPKLSLNIRGGILTIKRGGASFSHQVPSETENAHLKNISRICVLKQDSKVSVSEECPVCNRDFNCEDWECKEECVDCRGPKPQCIGDDYCNDWIGENCKNSPNDCTCKPNKICCPDDPSDNDKGCVDDTKGDEGDKCWCDNQCLGNLKCNPTAPDFHNFEKACCPDEKSWNGTECIETKKFKLIIIPTHWSDLSRFEEIARANGEWWLSLTYLKNCPERTEIVVVDEKKCVTASTSRILHCARNWGLIPKDDPTGKYWRLVGLDQYWSAGKGRGGYVMEGGLGSPLVKVTWVTTIWGRKQGREKRDPPFPHELGHTFGLCGEYCGPGDCDGPVYFCGDINKCPIHCRNINKIPSNPIDPNCVMNNKGARYYHSPGKKWLKNRGLPVSMKEICKGKFS